MKLTLPIENVSPLIPQSGEMVLVDRVIDYGADFLLVKHKLNLIIFY